MAELVEFRSNEGKLLGIVSTATHACFRVYKISDVFNCLGIPIAYAIHVDERIKLGKYLYATWPRLVDYFQRMRQPTGLIIDFMNRREPEHYPEQVKIEFQETPFVRYLKTLDDMTLCLVLRNLDLFVLNTTLFQMAVGRPIYKEIDKFEFKDVAGLTASHAAYLLRPVLQRLEQMKVERQQKPIDVEFKDGKLVIELAINGICPK